MTNKDLACRAQSVATLAAGDPGRRIALCAEIALRTTPNVAEARKCLLEWAGPENIVDGAVDLISTLIGGESFTRRTP